MQQRGASHNPLTPRLISSPCTLVVHGRHQSVKLIVLILSVSDYEEAIVMLCVKLNEDLNSFPAWKKKHLLQLTKESCVNSYRPITQLNR